MVPGTEAERERDQRDQHERREDPPEARPPLALGVEVGPREDERGDQGQEGKPVRLDAPEKAPEQVGASVVELSHDERGVDAQDEAREVEAEERRDAREPAGHPDEPAPVQEEGLARADVGDERGRPLVRSHDGGGDPTPPPSRSPYCH